MKLFVLLAFLSNCFSSKCLSLKMKVSKVEQQIEKNPNFGAYYQPGTKRYYVYLSIPTGGLHYYGVLDERATAREAVMMIVGTYKKSLEMDHPATFHKLKLKFYQMFVRPLENKVSKVEKNQILAARLPRKKKKESFFKSPDCKLSRERLLVEKFKQKLEHIQNSPNFGVHLRTDTASPTYTDYLKNLEHSPATYDELRQKYGSMAKRCTKFETKMSPERIHGEQNEFHAAENNGENVFLNAESKEGTQAGEDSLTSAEDENFKSSETDESKEIFANIEPTNRNEEAKFNRNKLDFVVEEFHGKKNIKMSIFMNYKLYKVLVSSLQVNENVEFPYEDGWRVYLERGELFTVSVKKRLVRDPNGWNRIRGFCEEYGGWATLKYIDEGLDLAKEVKKRKRNPSENESEELDHSVVK